MTLFFLGKVYTSCLLLSHFLKVEALLHNPSSSNDYVVSESNHIHNHNQNQKNSYLRSQKEATTSIPTQREIIEELFSSLRLHIYEDDECESQFISCENGIVKKVEVKHYSKIWSTHDSGQQGQIPRSIELLTDLEEIVLDGVPDLSGSLPTELGSLSKLRILRLADNTVLGQVPTELGNLNHLEWLDLAYNALTGSIPSELGKLQNAKRLNLGHNNMKGEIPKELGNLNNVKMIDLSYNKLTGTIPTELNALDNLIWFELHDNGLNGNIPDKLKTLSSLEEMNLNPPTISTSESDWTFE